MFHNSKNHTEITLLYHIKPVIITALFLWHSFVTAQVTVFSSNEFRETNGTVTSLIAADNNFYYWLRINDKDNIDCSNQENPCYFDRFDENLKHIESIPVIFPGDIDPKKVTPKKFFAINNRFYLFLEESIYTTGDANAYLAIFDGKRTGEIVKVGQVSNVDYPTTNDIFKEKCEVFFLNRSQQDNEDVFLFYEYYPSKESLDLEFTVKIYDLDGKKLMEKHLALNVYPEFSEVSDILYYNKELFFVLTTSIPFEDPVCKLVDYNFSKDETSFYDFKLMGKKIESIMTGQTVKGNIYMAGVYSSTNNENKDKRGVFYFLFEETNQDILSNGFSEIVVPENEYKHVDTDNLEVKKLYLAENNEVTIISEINSSETIQITDSENKFYFKPYYHSDDIIVSHYRADGSLKFQQWVHKKQYRDNINYTSHFSVLINKTLCLIYNDHPKNIQYYERGLLKTMQNKFKPVVAILNLNNGVMKKEIVPFSTKDLKALRLDPLSGVEYRHKLLYSSLEGATKLVKISFEDSVSNIER